MCACVREVWKIDVDAGFDAMRVCPDGDGKKKKWRESMVVTWKQQSILYAIGCTHTIDGQGNRKLPTPKITRISDGGKSPCINAGLRSPRSDSDSSWAHQGPGHEGSPSRTRATRQPIKDQGMKLVRGFAHGGGPLLAARFKVAPRGRFCP